MYHADRAAIAPNPTETAPVLDTTFPVAACHWELLGWLSDIEPNCKFRMLFMRGEIFIPGVNLNAKGLATQHSCGFVR
jgi:hypothetical protein